MSMRAAMRASLVLTLLTACTSGLSASPPNKRVIPIAVPRAPPAITIIGQARPRTHPQLTVNLEVDDKGKPVRPADLYEMVEFIKDALPRKFLETLAWEFGYQAGSPEQMHEDISNQEIDLFYFLLDVWNLRDRSTVLGRQYSCVSPGDELLFPIWPLVVDLEISGDAQVRRDIPRDFQVHASRILAHRLREACTGGGGPVSSRRGSAS